MEYDQFDLLASKRQDMCHKTIPIYHDQSYIHTPVDKVLHPFEHALEKERHPVCDEFQMLYAQRSSTLVILEQSSITAKDDSYHEAFQQLHTILRLQQE